MAEQDALDRSSQEIADRTACGFWQVSRFIDPEWLVEIEADAVVDAAGDAL